MRKIQALVIGLAGVALGASLALAAVDYGELKGSYRFFSYELDDPGPPTAKDTKLVVHIVDPVAANIYDRMGKAGQVEDVCGAGLTGRRRGPLECTRDKGSTRCSMVLDLRSGKATGLPC